MLVEINLEELIYTIVETIENYEYYMKNMSIKPNQKSMNLQANYLEVYSVIGKKRNKDIINNFSVIFNCCDIKRIARIVRQWNRRNEWSKELPVKEAENLINYFISDMNKGGH